MAFFLAVANRKGGVGKSTISVMIAHAFAVWGAKRVLLVDLDAQSNSSLILLGGASWVESQVKSKNIAAFIEDRMYGTNPIADYLIHQVGDVSGRDGKPPRLSLLSGSLGFEDLQDELITFYSRNNTPFRQAKVRCADHFRRALNLANPLADLIVLDCAPGLSNATAAALALANKVIVPFRPDAVSEFAVDRISTIVEGKQFDDVMDSAKPSRRYFCLANYVRPGGRDRIYVDTIAGKHPTLATQIPLLPDVANAFDWLDGRMPLEEKYGAAVPHMKSLHAELSTLTGLS